MGNTLIAIDCQENVLRVCFHKKPLTRLCILPCGGDQLLLLTRDELRGRICPVNFFSYNPSTGMVSEELTEKISKDGMTGRIIWCFCAAGEFFIHA